MRLRGLFLLGISIVVTAVWAEPCTTTAPACTEWVKLGSASSRSLIYRTYSLDTKNENITRALIMVHGAGRDAHNYFRTAVAAAFLAGALDNTVVIAPRFASSGGGGCNDALAADEVNWPWGGGSRRSRGGAANNKNRHYSHF